MFTSPAPRKAYLAIQCLAPGEAMIGTFLYDGAESHREKGARLVSPVFPSLANLSPWLDANGWREGTFDHHHPVGVYTKSVQRVAQERSEANVA